VTGSPPPTRWAPAPPPFVAALAASLADAPGAPHDDPGLRAALAARAGGAPDVRWREAAVLVLLGRGADGGGDVVLLERAPGLRSHPGQVAFPGGALDPGDGGDPVAAALREAREETGLDPAGVRVLGTLPVLHVPPSGFRVTPVLAWHEVPAALSVGDAGEVAQVLRAPLPALADPAARVSVRAPSGWVGPAFTLGDLLVWGFTAALLAAVLRRCGLERPWDADRVVPLPARFAGPGGRAAT
jgi:8-oxo-dGTP pyrophosphatase MutT (NUDIX family)